METYRALQAMRRAGKTKAVGLSNYTIDDFNHLASKIELESDGNMPVCNQIEVNPFLYRKETIDFYQKKGILICAYKPLKAGAAMANEVVTGIAEQHKKSAAQVLLRWGVQHGICVLPKSSNEARMAANLDLFDFDLPEADMVALDGLMSEEAGKAFLVHYHSRRGQDYPPKVAEVEEEVKEEVGNKRPASTAAEEADTSAEKKQVRRVWTPLHLEVDTF